MLPFTRLLHRPGADLIRIPVVMLVLGGLVGLFPPASPYQPALRTDPSPPRLLGATVVVSGQPFSGIVAEATSRFERAGLHLEPFTVTALEPDENGACWDAGRRPIGGQYYPSTREVRLCPGRIGLHGVLHELAHHYEATTDQRDVIAYLTETFPRVKQASGHEHWAANASEWFADILGWGLGDGDRVTVNGQIPRLHVYYQPVFDVDVLVVWQMVTGLPDTLHGVLIGG